MTLWRVRHQSCFSKGNSGRCSRVLAFELFPLIRINYKEWGRRNSQSKNSEAPESSRYLYVPSGKRSRIFSLMAFVLIKGVVIVVLVQYSSIHTLQMPKAQSVVDTLRGSTTQAGTRRVVQSPAQIAIVQVYQLTIINRSIDSQIVYNRITSVYQFQECKSFIP